MSTSDAKSGSTAGEAQPVALFQGYDTFTSGGRSTVVKGESSSAGAEIKCGYTICYDYASLEKALDISASASAAFGGFDASGKVGFAQKLKVTNTCVSIVVYASIVSDSQTFTNAKLTTSPPDGDDESLTRFFRSYGDSFVSQIVKGAEYMAAYVFYSATEDQQKEVTATLSAKGIIAGGTMSASLQASLDEVQKSISTKQRMDQFITGFTNLPVPAPTAMVDFALNFSSLTPDQPVVISWQTLTYDHVTNKHWPSEFSSVIANVKLFAGAGTLGAPNGLDDDFAALSVLKNDIDSIQEVYETYDYDLGNDPDLEKNRQLVEDDLATLRVLFQEIEQAPTGLYERPVLVTLDLGTPELHCKLTTVGPFGSQTAGSPFQDVTEMSVAACTRVKGLTIWGDARFANNLTVTYTSGSGEDKVVQHGSESGSHQDWPLQSGDRIINVEAEAPGTSVGEIFMLSRMNNRILFPETAGGALGRTKVWTEPKDGVVRLIGFTGRSSKALYSLGVIIGTFSKATWKSRAPAG